ncbi:hypothetical protein Q5M85_12800 [Paraclostridium bifermentans]|nr:hypothetical protein [Paraclostridium bifermentans]
MNLYVGNGKITVTPSNELMVEGGASYKFSIVDFNDYKNLKKLEITYTQEITLKTQITIL